MSEESRPSERPRLQLRPRDPLAAQAYEGKRSCGGSNPFGAAKPREQVIAERLGKTEEEVLRDAVKKERPKLRLNAEQLERRKHAETRVEEAKAQLVNADDAERMALQAEVFARQEELEALLDEFEAVALEAAQRGEIQRPSERRHQQQQNQQLHGTHVEGDGSRQRGRAGYGRAGDRSGGYEQQRGHHVRGGEGGGRGGYDFERRQGGYDRDEGGHGSYGHRGDRSRYVRSDSSGVVHDRELSEGYDRPDRNGYERQGGHGLRDGGRGDGCECAEGDNYSGIRGGYGAQRGGGDWNPGGDRSRSVYDRDGSSERRGAAAATQYDRVSRRGNDRAYDPLRHGPSGGLDGGLHGSARRSVPRGGGNGPRGGGRGYDSTLEELVGTDYVSSYAVSQDRF